MRRTIVVGLIAGIAFIGAYLYNMKTKVKIDAVSSSIEESKEKPRLTAVEDDDFRQLPRTNSQQEVIDRIQRRSPLDHQDQARQVPANTAPKSQASKTKPKFSSLKAMHIDGLRKFKALDSLESVNEDGRLQKSTIVAPTSGRYETLMVRDIYKNDRKTIENTYVYVADEILVSFHDKPSSDDLKDFIRRHGLGAPTPLLNGNVVKFKIPSVSLSRFEKLERELPNDPAVKHRDGNSLRYTTKVPNDALYNSLWGLSNNGTDPVANRPFTEDLDIQADRAWENETDCSATVIAVLDTGADMNHPDLKDNLLPDLARDFTGSPNGPSDRDGHGTHVAGTVGAVGNNSIGVTGVCWKAQIIPVKVLGDDGTGTLQGIIDGYNYVAGTDTKVLNLSLGGGPPSPIEVDAIAANTSQGKILVIAAGNEDNDNDVNPAYPASYQDAGIISVAALHGGGDLAVFSNFGQTSVDIAAPGQDILSTVPTGFVQDPNNAYAALSGTSMASPHVAGAVALFWSYAPELSPQQVKQAMLDSSVTGSLSKAIANSRMMDLNGTMDEIKARANIVEIGETIKPTSSITYNLDLTTEANYSSIETIEIVHVEEVIGSVNGDASSISINLPLGFGSVEIFTRVTDSAGRVYLSDPMALDLDINKTLTFSQVESMSLSGSNDCVISKIVDGEEEVLHQESVDSIRQCEKLCDVVGPLLFSSKGEIQCAQGSDIIYQAKGN